MEKNLRFLILFFIGTLPLLSTAQKKDWSFSDRTGIKGIQISAGTYKIMNEASWKNMLHAYVQEIPLEDSIYVTQAPYYGSNRTLLQIEVVYAPFRFSTNPWLKNAEVFGGISHRAFSLFGSTEKSSGPSPNSYDEAIQSNWGGYVNENDFKYYDRTYSLRFSHTAAQVRIAVNKPILPSIMVYGSFGLGMGMSQGLTIQSSDVVESYYSPTDSTKEHYYKTNSIYSDREVFYQSKGIRQQTISLGMKYYLTCQLNIYAEYGMEFLQIHKPGTQSLQQNSRGFQFGIRFKFNPPELVDEEDKEKGKNVFW